MFAWGLRGLLFVAGFLLATLILVAEKAPELGTEEFVVGEPAPRTVFSPFNLVLEDESATSALRQKKQAEILPLYGINPEVSGNILKKVGKVFELASKVSSEKKSKDAGAFSAAFSELPLALPEDTFREVVHAKDLSGLRKKIENFLTRFLKEGIFDEAEKSKLLDSGVETVNLLRENSTERLSKVAELPTVGEMQIAAEEALNQKSFKEQDLKGLFLVFSEVSLEPNLVSQDEVLKERRQKAAQSIPPVEVKIKKNELVVQRGMLVSAQQKMKIQEIQKKRVEKKILNQFLGIGTIAFLIFLLTFIYLYAFDRKILMSFRMSSLILSVFLLTLFLCKIVALWPNASYFLMPVALAPLLLVLLSCPRMALFSAAAVTVLAMPLSGFSVDAMLGGFISSVACTFAAMKVRKRVQFLRLGAVVGGVYFVVLFALDLLREYSWTDSFYGSLPGLANGLMITMPLAFLLLPLFEGVFGLVTDISLLELSDLNHPILKKMMVEAPGTYHHSLVVSTLAEAACEAIGANALLGRVGAYFHDIGKISKSEWFIENQNDRKTNPHSGLSPQMSTQLIREHIRDGIELGRKYKLKERILQFVREHQGTAVISYFYQKALECASGGERVDLGDFRYAGPKPQSKETAVVLLADAVEAASRSLDHPTPDGVREVVKKLIDDRFIDGQFEECDLSLKDLKKIQKSFEHNLMAILHTRLRYPNMPGTEEKMSLFEKPATHHHSDKSAKRK